MFCKFRPVLLLLFAKTSNSRYNKVLRPKFLSGISLEFILTGRFIICFDVRYIQSGNIVCVSCHFLLKHGPILMFRKILFSCCFLRKRQIVDASAKISVRHISWIHLNKSLYHMFWCVLYPQRKHCMRELLFLISISGNCLGWKRNNAMSTSNIIHDSTYSGFFADDPSCNALNALQIIHLCNIYKKKWKNSQILKREPLKSFGI